MRILETGQGAAAPVCQTRINGFWINKRAKPGAYVGCLRKFNPLLVNTVCCFNRPPRYLSMGKEITRRGLEEPFCGKLLVCPWFATVGATPITLKRSKRHDNLRFLGVAGGTLLMAFRFPMTSMLTIKTNLIPPERYTLLPVLG